MDDSFIISWWMGPSMFFRKNTGRSNFAPNHQFVCRRCRVSFWALSWISLQSQDKKIQWICVTLPLVTMSLIKSLPDPSISFVLKIVCSHQLQLELKGIRYEFCAIRLNKLNQAFLLLSWVSGESLCTQFEKQSKCPGTEAFGQRTCLAGDWNATDPGMMHLLIPHTPSFSWNNRIEHDSIFLILERFGCTEERNFPALGHFSVARSLRVCVCTSTCCQWILLFNCSRLPIRILIESDRQSPPLERCVVEQLTNDMWKFVVGHVRILTQDYDKIRIGSFLEFFTRMWDFPRKPLRGAN